MSKIVVPPGKGESSSTSLACRSGFLKASSDRVHETTWPPLSPLHSCFKSLLRCNAVTDSLCHFNTFRNTSWYSGVPPVIQEELVSPFPKKAPDPDLLKSTTVEGAITLRVWDILVPNRWSGVENESSTLDWAFTTHGGEWESKSICQSRIEPFWWPVIYQLNSIQSETWGLVMESMVSEVSWEVFTAAKQSPLMLHTISVMPAAVTISPVMSLTWTAVAGVWSSGSWRTNSRLLRSQNITLWSLEALTTRLYAWDTAKHVTACVCAHSTFCRCNRRLSFCRRHIATTPSSPPVSPRKTTIISVPAKILKDIVHPHLKAKANAFGNTHCDASKNKEHARELATIQTHTAAYQSPGCGHLCWILRIALAHHHEGSHALQEACPDHRRQIGGSDPGSPRQHTCHIQVAEEPGWHPQYTACLGT